MNVATVTPDRPVASGLVLCLLLGAGGILGCGIPATVVRETEGLVVESDDCPAVSTWAAASVQFEDQVLALTNGHRADGAGCGDAGVFEPTHSLTMNSDLGCAARSHSLDMATRDFFDHVNLDGEDPGERIAATGYTASAWGENIAWGQATPEQVVAGWMNSPGHCANIMRPAFTEVGIGHHTSNTWTQVFAAPSSR